MLIARGWNGLNQIPSDPGYGYIAGQALSKPHIVSTSPYVHFDAPVVAFITSLFPIRFHGIVTTLTTHIVWTICAVVLSQVLKRGGFNVLSQFFGGLLLVATPWGAQSVIGNYGNIRWPILVAATVAISAEVTSTRPRAIPILVAALTTTLANPLHPLLLIPLIFGLVTLPSDYRRTLLIGALPLTLGLVVNLHIVGTGGHSEKIRSFWDGAGIFWVSGQVMPAMVALTASVFLVKDFRAWNQRRSFAANIFVMVMAIASASYQLGGIADRYYSAPATLAAVGVLVCLADFHTRSANVTKILTVVLTLVLAVPTVRWFFVFPYLRSAEGWSTQVERVREQCSTGEISSFELATSSGQSRTDPISCDDL